MQKLLFITLPIFSSFPLQAREASHSAMVFFRVVFHLSRLFLTFYARCLDHMKKRKKKIYVSRRTEPFRSLLIAAFSGLATEAAMEGRKVLPPRYTPNTLLVKQYCESACRLRDEFAFCFDLNANRKGKSYAFPEGFAGTLGTSNNHLQMAMTKHI